MPVCFFESMEYQRISPKQLVEWEQGVRQGLHAKEARQKLAPRMQLAFREVITYMTVRPAAPQALMPPASRPKPRGRNIDTFRFNDGIFNIIRITCSVQLE